MRPPTFYRRRDAVDASNRWNRDYPGHVVIKMTANIPIHVKTHSKCEMTRTEARKLYIEAGGPDDHGEDEWDEIHREMEAIVASKSHRAAGKLIEWWGCWDEKYTPTKFARRVREGAK